jgi:hypothetical protein
LPNQSNPASDFLLLVIELDVPANQEVNVVVDVLIPSRVVEVGVAKQSRRHDRRSVLVQYSQYVIKINFTITNLAATVDTYWMVPYHTIAAEEMDGKNPSRRPYRTISSKSNAEIGLRTFSFSLSNWTSFFSLSN